MIEYLMKLNKYQKGIIISLLIFSLSMLGFMFNTNVRISRQYDNVLDIVIDEPNLTEQDDNANTIFRLVLISMGVIIIWKIIGDLLDVF